MVNYRKGKIYKIVCNITGRTYYGSTVVALCKRLGQHKAFSNNCTSKIIIQGGNYDIVLVELFPCNTKEELHARERYFIENNECVNKVIPTHTRKEYRGEHKDEIAERDTKYYEENKVEIAKQKKEYREANKVEIAKQKKEYRDENKVEITERDKKYYEENKVVITEYKKQYQQIHKVEIAKKKKEYREEHKADIAKKRKEYWEANKDKINAKRRKTL
jgi:hypothetical protein